jgi:hypothetical protein
VAFVTSKSFTGDFGDGNKICKDAANGAGLGSKVFKAWLSYGSGVLCSGGPWALLDGTKVGGCNDLAMGTLSHAIDRTENNQPIGVGKAVWTGAESNGQGTTDCDNWQNQAAKGRAGNAAGVDKSWSSWTTFDCELEGRIYCFEQ